MYKKIVGLLAFSALTLSVLFSTTLLTQAQTSGSPLTLVKDVPAFIARINQGSAVYYRFTLASTTNNTSFSIRTTGISGDADIYLNKDVIRSNSASTWKSQRRNSSTETISIAAPVPGTYFLKVYAFSRTSSTTVTMTYGPVTATNTLTVTRSGTGTGSITSSPAGINCGTICTASYATGTIVTLTATPTGTNTFSGWTGACTGTGTCTVTMSAARSVGATFNGQVANTLTVTRSGTGTGSITSSPAGINCGTVCSTSFATGTIVTLTPTPLASSTFSGWTGACTGTGTCTVTMSAARTVGATFAAVVSPTNNTLTVTKSGTGTGTVTSSPAGISCGATCSGSYASGTLVTLTQSGLASSTFGGWTGSCSGTGACTVTMSAARTVGAIFTAPVIASSTKFTLNQRVAVTSGPLNVRATANGTLLGTQASGVLGAVIGGPVSANALWWWNINFDSGVDGWVAEDFVTATTTPAPSIQNTLSVSLLGTGSGVVTSSPTGINCGVTCGATYATGTIVTLTATPTGTNTFSGWTGACTGTGTCTVTMSAARSVGASFVASLPPAATAPSAGWNQIAVDGAAFTLLTPGVVKYGVYTTWTEQSLSAGSYTCSTALFGDPAPGTPKACFAQGAATTTTTNKFAMMDMVYVSSGPLNVRSTAGGSVIGTQLASSSGMVMNGPTANGGYTWWYVDFTYGNDGWVAEDFISKGLGGLSGGSGGTIPLAQLPKGAKGTSTLIIVPAEVPVRPGVSRDTFRTFTNFTHFNYDDPIVLPGVSGGSHLHMYYGNSKIDAFTTTENIRTNCLSASSGGTANCTGYWMPAILDVDGNPVIPHRDGPYDHDTVVYYKTGYAIPDATTLVAAPVGLRMIAGRSSATPANPQPTDYTATGEFVCYAQPSNDQTARSTTMPNCPQGSTLEVMIHFPQCWNGRDLDSADHKSHMAYPEGGTGCPTTHPMPILQISLVAKFEVRDPRGTAGWRLSSDMYATSSPGGHSLHADWLNGWDPAIMQRFVVNCGRAEVDCLMDNLNDGYQLYNDPLPLKVK